MQIRRLELHRRCEANDREIRLAIRQQEHSQAVMRTRKLRVSPKNLLQLSNGSLHIAGQRQRGRELLTQRQVVRRELQAGPKLGDGSRELAARERTITAAF